MNMPSVPAFTETSITKEEIVAAFDARTTVTVGGFTGVVSFYDSIPAERGGSPWFYISTSDMHMDEYGPFYWSK